jgi:hypothetical protein
LSSLPHLEDPKVLAAWAGMYTDAGPAFYLEHLISREYGATGHHGRTLRAGVASGRR